MEPCRNLLQAAAFVRTCAKSGAIDASSRHIMLQAASPNEPIAIHLTPSTALRERWRDATGDDHRCLDARCAARPAFPIRLERHDFTSASEAGLDNEARQAFEMFTAAAALA
jgi:hypothetical protein